MRQRQPIDVLRELNDRVEEAQGALDHYLLPDSGITPRDTISNVLGILDDREFLEIQSEARALLGKQPAFFKGD